MNPITEGTQVLKHTPEFIKCTSCLYGNYFVISAVKQGDLYYYITTCPRCKHNEEIKLVSYRVAKDYLPETPATEETK